MSIINASKPTTSITNTTKVTLAELWSTITTTWASETRTWADCVSLITNTSRRILTTIASYTSANYDTYYTMNSLNQTRVGQSFLNTNAIIIDSVKFQLANGIPHIGIGQLAYAVLYAHSGTFGTSSLPTGSPLATSVTIDASTITFTPQMVEFNFTGSNRISLSSNTHYCIECVFSGSSSLSIGFDASSPTASGNLYWYSGSLNAEASKDLIFEVYGDPFLMVNTSKP